MTGTMARPSSPSVRFTALEAPTMTKTAKTMKNQPRFSSTSFKKGNRQMGFRVRSSVIDMIQKAAIVPVAT